MLVRRAELGDETAVAGVHVRSWQVAYRGLLPDAYLAGLRSADRAARYTFADHQQGKPETLVIIDDGSLCGFATLGPSRDADCKGGELYAFYVEPARWGQGLGRELMRSARERLGLQGFGEAILWMLVGNQRAERFYRGDGWAPDGSRRTLKVQGVEVDELRYGRALP